MMITTITVTWTFKINKFTVNKIDKKTNTVKLTRPSTLNSACRDNDTFATNLAKKLANDVSNDVLTFQILSFAVFVVVEITEYSYGNDVRKMTQFRFRSN